MLDWDGRESFLYKYYVDIVLEVVGRVGVLVIFIFGIYFVEWVCRISRCLFFRYLEFEYFLRDLV